MNHRAERQTAPRSRSPGFALVSAMFLLIIMAALGAFMVNLSTMEAGTVELSTSSSRVYYGARSGLEWAIHSAVAPAAGTGTCNPTSTFTLAGGALSGVSVTVTCASTTHNGNFGAIVYVYYLTSTASVDTLGSAGYAERKLTAQVCRSNFPTAAAC